MIGESANAKGYIYAELEVTDPALFETYRPLAAASIEEFGGRYAVRGGDPKVLEGDGPPPRSVLLEFDSPERAMGGTTRRSIKPPYRSGYDPPRPRS